MNRISLAINPFLEANQGAIKPITGARILSVPVSSQIQDPLRKMVEGIIAANQKNASWIQKLRRLFSTVRVEVEKISFPVEEPLSMPEIVPPRMLAFGQLPAPPFHSQIPPRFFWHPSQAANQNLLRETSDEVFEPASQAALILSRAKEMLPQHGVLKQDAQGLIYLDLPEAYTTELLPLIADEGAEIPPYYSPHVVAILPQEHEQRKELESLKVLGQTVSFTVTGCTSLKPRGWEEMERVWIVTIQSPELETLRARALLPPKILAHEFHIVIGTRRAEQPSLETFRINVSCYAA